MQKGKRIHGSIILETKKIVKHLPPAARGALLKNAKRAPLVAEGIIKNFYLLQPFTNIGNLL
jgi:hypothetical protein